ITIGLIGDSQIGSVSGTKLTVDSIDSSKLRTTELAVGGGGGKPGKLSVKNSGGTEIAFLGNVSGSDYGGWFQVFGAGGSNYATAKVYTNSSGNLFIRDADMSVSASGSTISTSPTTYDPTYSSLMVKIISGGTADEARYV